MPVVMDYTDIEALGTLAYQGGKMLGTAQRRETAQGRRERQRQGDINMVMGIRQQQFAVEQAQADRDMRERMFSADQEYRYEALGQRKAQDEMRLQATIQQAGLAQAGDIERLQMQQTGRVDLAELAHQQDLERIAQEAAFGKYRYKGKPTEGVGISPAGVPNKTAAAQEIARYRHLAPTEPEYAGRGEDYAESGKKTTQAAENFATMPTAHLQAYLDQEPDGPWADYLRAVIQDRQAIGVRAESPATGAQVGPGASLLGGQGLAETPYSGLADEDLDAKARQAFQAQPERGPSFNPWESYDPNPGPPR
ncbi:hypothetical protein LCGC14_2711720 [marine sediment metagenome]|uniref:Uncharacterized protein n=1 Tax=marine sediment metagenome TaxID=412755 RepID=A0A0F9C4G8_9ZZZZ